jgi:predicted Zn finger-like uncharacterized protein
MMLHCPNCDALYQVVKDKAPSGTIDRWVTCQICSGPLPAREGKFVLKYFLLRKADLSRKVPRRRSHTGA